MDPETLQDMVADAEGEVRVLEARLAAAEAADPDLTDTDPDQMARVEQTAAARRKVTRLRRELAQAEVAAAYADTSDSSPEPPRQLEFDSAEQWLNEYALPMWRRPSVVWCRSWWEHTEALSRIEGLWRGWEATRWEGPGAMSAWFRDHFDYHMAVLTNPSGTFKDCDWESNRHKLQTQVETNPSPPAVWELRLKALTTDRATGEIS